MLTSNEIQSLKSAFRETDVDVSRWGENVIELDILSTLGSLYAQNTHFVAVNENQVLFFCPVTGGFVAAIGDGEDSVGICYSVPVNALFKRDWKVINRSPSVINRHKEEIQKLWGSDAFLRYFRRFSENPTLQLDHKFYKYNGTGGRLLEEIQDNPSRWAGKKIFDCKNGGNFVPLRSHFRYYRIGDYGDLTLVTNDGESEHCGRYLSTALLLSDGWIVAEPAT